MASRDRLARRIANADPVIVGSFGSCSTMEESPSLLPWAQARSRHTGVNRAEELEVSYLEAWSIIKQGSRTALTETVL